LCLANRYQKQDEAAAEPTTEPAPATTTTAKIDTDLEVEEKLAELASQNSKLGERNNVLAKQNADLNTRLERLSQNNEALQKELGAAQDQISGRKATDDGSVENTIKRLETRISEQDDLIANQEAQIESNRALKASLEDDLNEFKTRAASVDSLRDEISELKHQNAELTKKANTADKYKNKLELKKDLETEIQQLRVENQELYERIGDNDRLAKENATLRESHTQFLKRISGYEVEIFEFANLKKSFELEAQRLNTRLANAEELRKHDEEFIAKLQDDIAVAHRSPVSSPTKATASTLEAELGDVEEMEATSSLELQISRLTSENQILKKNTAAGQENTNLQLLLDEANSKLQTFEEKYNILYADHVVLQEEMSAIMEKSTSEELVHIVNRFTGVGCNRMLMGDFYRNEAFINLRKQTMRLTDENSALNRELIEVKADNSKLSREIISLKGDRKFSPFKFLVDCANHLHS
jgi:protein HOOK3